MSEIPSAGANEETRSPGGRIALRAVIVVALVGFLGLFAVYLRDALLTARLVSALRNVAPGTAFAEVAEQHGPPDRIEATEGVWTYRRWVRQLPEEVTRVAVYAEAISPQVCAFMLDAEDRVIGVEVVAAY